MTVATGRVRKLYDDSADHLLREPERRVAEVGLQIEQCEFSKLGLVLRLAARKPS